MPAIKPGNLFFMCYNSRMLNELKKSLRKYINPEKAPFFPKFFKAGKGEYGEGDKFLGVTVPNIRLVVKQFFDLSISDIRKLLYSKIHEERLTALLILVSRYAKGGEMEKAEIYDFYVKNSRQANNWDLVDLSAHKIMGPHLIDSPDKKIIYKFAKSENLWERRIAILTTFAFIAKKKFDDSLAIAEILVNDTHDLIHKAVGWMLREIGKRDLAAEEKFLKKHYKTMPRTMLRYAIEKFPEKKRRFYMGK
jgi:3-methyladenine DNA glycosylase AlkD